MAKQIILTENQLNKLINESVKRVISEMDWKTYQSAMEKAAKLADDKTIDDWERQRRSNQRDAFRGMAIDTFDKQFGIDKIKQNRNDAENRGENYVETNGELKRLSRGAQDSEKYFSGNANYENGKWN